MVRKSPQGGNTQKINCNIFFFPFPSKLYGMSNTFYKIQGATLRISSTRGLKEFDLKIPKKKLGNVR